MKVVRRARWGRRPQTFTTADLHKPPEGVRVDLDGRQRRDALHAAPLPTNAASIKSRVADSSIQLRWGGGAPRGHKCVRRISKEGSNNGATAPADEHRFAIRGLPLSEDRLSLREAARRMIGS
jgi:hypothetical protein